ncbi:MAG: hypothetical protein P8Y00_07870, partial [Deltaproteobacteria bacterium]
MNLRNHRILSVLKSAPLLFLPALIFSSCAGHFPYSPPKARESVAQTLGMPAPKQETDALSKAYTDFTMAVLALSDHQYPKAKEYLAKAIEKDPDSIHLNRTMALVLKKLKEYQKATLYAKKCVELDGKNLRHRIMLADLYTLTGDDDLAFKEYQKILQVQPTNQRARLILSTILIRKRNFKEALPELEKLLQQN